MDVKGQRSGTLKQSQPQGFNKCGEGLVCYIATFLPLRFLLRDFSWTCKRFHRLASTAAGYSVHVKLPALLGSQTFDNILLQFPKLTSLDMSACLQLGELTLATLATFPTIQRLDLPKGHEDPELFLWSILEKLPALTAVNGTYWGRSWDQALLSIFKYSSLMELPSFKNLRSLGLDVFNLQQPENSSLLDRVAELPLTSLALRRVQIPQEVMPRLSKLKLHSLSLEQCEPLSASDFQHMNTGQMRRFRYRPRPNLEERSQPQVLTCLRGSTTLEELDMETINGDELKYLLRAPLKTLTVGRLTYAATLRRLGCRHLRELSIERLKTARGLTADLEKLTIDRLTIGSAGDLLIRDLRHCKLQKLSVTERLDVSSLSGICELKGLTTLKIDASHFSSKPDWQQMRSWPASLTDLSVEVSQVNVFIAELPNAPFKLLSLDLNAHDLFKQWIDLSPLYALPLRRLTLRVQQTCMFFSELAKLKLVDALKLDLVYQPSTPIRQHDWQLLVGLPNLYSVASWPGPPTDICKLLQARCVLHTASWASAWRSQ